MNGNFLLDTNIVIAILAQDEAIAVKLQSAGRHMTTSIVLGELFYGAFKSARVGENLAKIDSFAKGVPVLACDSGTSRVYGSIKQQLKQDGHPIPENDIWIAAISMQHNLTLVSRDAHFSAVKNLLLESW